MEIVLKLIIVAIVFNWVVSLIIPVVTATLNYILRKNWEASWFQQFKHKQASKHLGFSGDCVDYTGAIEFGCSVLLVIVCLLFILFCPTSTLSIIGSFLFYVICFFIALPVLRFLVDTAKNLKVNKSDGDSKRLREMQQKIDALTEKVNNS